MAYRPLERHDSWDNGGEGEFTHFNLKEKTFALIAYRRERLRLAT